MPRIVARRRRLVAWGVGLGLLAAPLGTVPAFADDASTQAPAVAVSETEETDTTAVAPADDATQPAPVAEDGAPTDEGTDAAAAPSAVAPAEEGAPAEESAPDAVPAPETTGTAGTAPLVADARVAAAAASVDLTFLNINDFHGRIDANTVKFAGTIEQLRAQNPNAVLLSDGDNIGASLFASSSQDDIPTLDVLNALDLRASSVGNHEFDRGFDVLTDEVAAAADFPYLGANVYFKGTTTPALDEYVLLDVGGISVAVIGAVTQETPALVSPGGIEALDFGDPVDAVNRVAERIAAEGTADVIVAEYHEGAGAGTPEGATLEDEVAAGGAFAKIVTQTSPAVDVVFTGHTHKQYAWLAAKSATDSTPRSVLQTGSYGENIGKVTLSYDVATDTVSNLAAVNVPRTTADDATLVATYPRVAEVKSITDAALAAAAVLGNQPVGSVSADITTAFAPGTGGATTRDDRASESTLGTVVANALRETLDDPALGGAEIGVVNPGGLRADLLKGTDGGIITYAEANAVLPFVNNLWTTTLTGAQFKTALEQQWQRDAAGAVPSRPYLQLGLSDNVSYTFDPTLPEGQRITSILVNGEPIDPARQYRIGSFSFLLQGGDNFRVFAEGADTRDSGLIDRDAWITYLGNHQGLTPSFARRSVQVSGAPTAPVEAGQAVAFTVSKLDLTSLGSPANTSLAVTWSDGTALGSVPVSAGTANVSLVLPAALEAAAGYLTLTASPSGTEVRVPLTVLPHVTVPAPGSQPGAGAPATGGVSAPAGTGAGTKSGTGAVRSGAETRALASTGVDPIGGVAAGVLLALIGAALTGGSLRQRRAVGRRS